MDRVAAEVAQEVGVLLQDQRVDTRTRQKIAGHHPGGPAARDAARRRPRLGHCPKLSISAQVRQILRSPEPVVSMPDTREDNMPQFLVRLYDGTDPEAPSRRQAARSAHFARLPEVVARGTLISGGAILDEKGAMIASYLLAECESRAELDSFLAEDPYTQGGVWQRVEVHPVRVAIRDGKILP
jgi:uncharacterized protein